MNNHQAAASARPITLAERCSTSLLANGELIGAILSDFPPEKLEAIDNLLKGGGSVGIETLVNGKAANVIRLVGQEREGARLVLATITHNAPKGAH